MTFKRCLVLVLMIWSSQSFATQSRLFALGMDELDREGSQYIDDERNMFFNPATIVDHGNKVVMDLGGSGLSGIIGKDGANFVAIESSSALSNPGTPKAEGGAFFNMKNGMTSGIYLGNESRVGTMLRILGTSHAVHSVTGSNAAPGTAITNAQTLPIPDNTIDLFLAGKFSSGLKWGVNFLYANFENTSEKEEAVAMATRLGLIGSNWNYFLILPLKSTSESTDSVNPGGGIETIKHEFEGSFGIHTGGTYKYKNISFFFYYKALD